MGATLPHSLECRCTDDWIAAEDCPWGGGYSAAGPVPLRPVVLSDYSTVDPDYFAKQLLKGARTPDELSHDAEMELRARVEQHLTAERVRTLLRQQNHLLANKSPQEVESIGRLLMRVYISGLHREMP